MIEILNIRQLQGSLPEIQRILTKLGVVSASANSSYRLMDLLDTLRDDLVVSVEYEYVDAMYRDEYYRFYATKYHKYPRNCAKMSFFESGALTPGCLVDYSKSDEIRRSYLGFVVLRPIDACIGRNVISVKAKKAVLNDIAICHANVNTTALGLKVCVDGFPHSSQDSEMMACAETALWSISEYYGHKYPGYKPVSPSEILEAMRPFSHQRQLPSKGLTFDQISIGMKTFGFSPEVYQLYRTDPSDPNKQVISEEMKEVFSCYVESGFPLALCLQGSTVGHAAVCVGRVEKNRALNQEKVNGRDLYFFNQSVDEFVVNDDNYPSYQKTIITAPTCYYSDANWKDVLLTSFMVPLPSKVYMDAYLAINQSKFLLGHFAPDGSVVRTYLASSRSLRDHVAASKVMPNEDKQILLDIPFPRFVWVTEFGTIDEYNHAVNSGIIVLDATEPTDRSTNPLIMAINGNRGVIYNMEQNRFDNLNLPENLIIEKYDKNIN